MIDKRVITPEDLGDGIEWNEQTQKYEAKLLFTDRAITASIQNSGMTLLYRQLKNANRAMVCTGIKLYGNWYGDSPEGEPSRNPF